MLDKTIVGADLRHLTDVVNNLQGVQEDYENVTIYEVIAYLHKAIFPLLIESPDNGDKSTIFRSLLLREVPALLKVVANKCKYCHQS